MTGLEEVKIVARTLMENNKQLAQGCNDDLYSTLETQRIFEECARTAAIILASIEAIEAREKVEAVG